MSTTRITLDELRKMPPLTKKQLEKLEAFKDVDFSDCPPCTPEQLKQFRPMKEVMPELYAQIHQTPVKVKIDQNVFAKIKAKHKDYKTFINETLKKAVM